MIEFLQNFAAQASVAIENSLMFEKTTQSLSVETDTMLSNFKGAIFTIGEDEKVITSNKPYKNFCIEEDRIKNGSFKSWLQPLHATEIENNHKLIDDIDRVLKFKYPVYCSHYLFHHPQNPAHKMFIDYNIFPMSDVSDKPSVVLVFKEAMNHTPNVVEHDSKRRGSFPLDKQQLTEKVRPRRLEKVTILFSDIRGFTTMTESMALEEIVDMLNAYFTEMVDAVFNSSGTLDKYIGDGMLCVFGLTPTTKVDLNSGTDSINACNAALSMREKLSKFNETRTEETKISIGVGISTGKVSVGTIGSSQHFEFTVIGDDVNLACRLEGCTKIYGVHNMILCSDSTYKEAQECFVFRRIDILCVKGKSKPIRVYELLGLSADHVERRHPGIMKALDVFHSALDLFEKKEWKEAKARFEKVLQMCDDPVSKHYIDRCSDYILVPPPPEWDGVWRLPEK